MSRYEGELIYETTIKSYNIPRCATAVSKLFELNGPSGEGGQNALRLVAEGWDSNYNSIILFLIASLWSDALGVTVYRITNPIHPIPSNPSHPEIALSLLQLFSHYQS